MHKYKAFHIHCTHTNQLDSIYSVEIKSCIEMISLLMLSLIMQKKQIDKSYHCQTKTFSTSITLHSNSTSFQKFFMILLNLTPLKLGENIFTTKKGDSSVFYN